MRKKRTFWVQAYREVLENMKQAPDFKLIEYLNRIPRGPVLDLGMGKGRHALFFAKLGRKVEGVDTSKLAKGLPKVVEAEGLDFTYHRMDIREFRIPPRRYALIIAARIIQLFRKSDIEIIAERLQAGLKPKGILYIFTFSIEDLQNVQSWGEIEKVEKNTYYLTKYNHHFHFFSRNEILGLFPELKLRYYTEGLTFYRSKSRSQLRGVIQYVGQKDAANE